MRTEHFNFPLTLLCLIKLEFGRDILLPGAKIDQEEQTISCSQHRGDFILPWSFGHLDI